MISFENNKLNNLALPMNILRMLSIINEYKGKQDLYKFSSAKGGSYKNTDNIIEEILQNGAKYIRFKPVDTFSTPSYMSKLCEEYRKEIAK